MESPAHCEIISSTSEEMKKLLAPPDQRDYHLTFLIKLSLTITISSFIFGKA